MWLWTAQNSLLGACEPYIYDNGVINVVDNFDELMGNTGRNCVEGEWRSAHDEGGMPSRSPPFHSEHAASLGIASVDTGDGLVCNVMTDGF